MAAGQVIGSYSFRRAVEKKRKREEADKVERWKWNSDETTGRWDSQPGGNGGWAASRGRGDNPPYPPHPKRKRPPPLHHQSAPHAVDHAAGYATAYAAAAVRPPPLAAVNEAWAPPPLAAVRAAAALEYMEPPPRPPPPAAPHDAEHAAFYAAAYADGAVRTPSPPAVSQAEASGDWSGQQGSSNCELGWLVGWLTGTRQVGWQASSSSACCSSRSFASSSSHSNYHRSLDPVAAPHRMGHPRWRVICGRQAVGTICGGVASS